MLPTRSLMLYWMRKFILNTFQDLKFAAIYKSLNKSFIAFIQLLKRGLKSLYFFFLTIGFISCLEDPCIVFYNSGIIIFFYIDDFLFISPCLQVQEIVTLKKVLNEKYSIKDLGPISSFLNIKITRDCEARILQIL